MRIPTVLVIGAGASKPYGFPLGNELVEPIVNSVAELKEPMPGTFGAITHDDDVGRARLEEDARRLSDRIARSGTSTIDEFLKECGEPDRSTILRSLIRVIWSAEDRAARVKNWASDDWIRWLWFERLRSPPTDFSDHKLVIVTFNYERMVAIRLATLMAALYSRSIADCWQSIKSDVPTTGNNFVKRFKHVYGSIAIPVQHDSGNGVVDCCFSEDYLVKACEGVRTIGQPLEAGRGRRAECVLRETWYDGLWSWAERIYFIGLGYHEQNLKYIGLTPEVMHAMGTEKRFLGGTGYGLSQGDRARALELVDDGFVLGDSDQRSTDFLAEHLPPDDDL